MLLPLPMLLYALQPPGLLLCFRVISHHYGNYEVAEETSEGDHAQGARKVEIPTDGEAWVREPGALANRLEGLVGHDNPGEIGYEADYPSADQEGKGNATCLLSLCQGRGESGSNRQHQREKRHPQREERARHDLLVRVAAHTHVVRPPKIACFWTGFAIIRVVIERQSADNGLT